MEKQDACWFEGADNEKVKSVKQRIHRKPAKTFAEALKRKYCTNYEMKTPGVVIVFHGRPKSTDEAELGYLRNVVLSDCWITHSGLERDSMSSLCPNVVDLDLSGNLLDTWSEILPIISQLDNLKFLNLAGNKIKNTQGELQKWTRTLPAIENLVLNMTDIQWSDILCLCGLLHHLRELHICGNSYSELPEIGGGGLETVECLRMNNNRIESWKEIWKLCHLPNLKSMILSGNPLLDVFFLDNDLDVQCVCCCHHDDNRNSDTTDDIIYKDCEAVVQYLVEEVLKTVTTEIEDSENTVNQNTDSVNWHGNLKAGSNDEHRNQNTEFDNRLGNQNIDSNEGHGNQNTGNMLSNHNTESDNSLSNHSTESENWLSNQNRELGNGYNICDDVSGDANINMIYESGDSSDNKYDVEEAVEAWYERIVGDVVRNLEIKSSQTPRESKRENNPSKCCQNKNINLNNLNDQNLGNQTELKMENTSKVDESSSGRNSEITCTCYCVRKESLGKPFKSLETLCLSETNIGKWKHLSALSTFPSLKALRIKDVKLGSKLSAEDRRKLFLASLPNINFLNGSEVAATERDKSERHLVRYFMDKKKKPDIYHSLKKKHGNISELVDIDINRGYKERVTLTFIYQGEVVFTQTVSVKEPVGRLRLIIAEKLCLYASLKNIQMYHRYSGPYHQDIDVHDIGEDGCKCEQLVLDTLPMSRFDIMDGDEIHIDVCDSFKRGCMNYLYVRNYLPKFTSDITP